jgi:predicted RNase H-like HicB family nuclease
MSRLHPDSQAGYYGQAPSREEAMQEAQDNWEAHKAHVDAHNPLKNDGGGYDINDIMREQGF